MTPWYALLVFLGGGAGAVGRYLLDKAVQSRHKRDFPLGTLVVNVLGCIVIGIVTGHRLRHGWSADTYTLVGVGFCGGLTTFSTFAVESVHLTRHRRFTEATTYLVASCAAGILAATLTFHI